MSNKVNSRYKLIIFIPLIIGILIDNIIFISKIYDDIFMFVSIIFIAFWFWTGKLFARLSESKRKGFYLGNSLWFISLLIFRLWLYLPIPNQRNIITIFLEKFAQYYVICITPIVLNIFQFIDMYFLISSGGGRVSVAYILMFLVFSAGFSYELYWNTNKKNFITIIALLTIITLPVINMLTPFPQGVKESGVLTKGSTEEIKSFYSDYSRTGLEIRIFYDIKDGKIDWKITNPKGDIIYAGYEVVEDGKIYSQLTYPDNYLNGLFSKKIEVTQGSTNTFSIKSPNMLGKYTLTIKTYEAEGKYDVYWFDIPHPLY